MAAQWNARSVRELGAQLSNWGRWGADDERGTLNFITPERVLAACALPASNDPRTQLELNLDIPVELAGELLPSRLAYLKFVEENDDLFTDAEQRKIRKQVLSGSRGLTLTF